MWGVVLRFVVGRELCLVRIEVLHLVEVDDLRTTVNYHELICGQKVVRCVSMA